MRRIETERLILDKWTTSEEDIKGLYEYAKNPDVGPNAGWKPHDSEAESREIIEKMFIPHDVWAIREKASGKVIGSIGLEPDKRRECEQPRDGLLSGKGKLGQRLYDRGSQSRNRLCL